MLAFVRFVSKELQTLLKMYTYGSEEQKAKCFFIQEEGRRTHLSVESAHK